MILLRSEGPTPNAARYDRKCIMPPLSGLTVHGAFPRPHGLGYWLPPLRDWMTVRHHEVIFYCHGTKLMKDEAQEG